MKQKISKRLAEIVDALPLFDGIRVLEIGCGPGVVAREVAVRIGKGYILAIDRSSKAINQAIDLSKEEIASGCLGFKNIAIEDFELEEDEPLYDIVFAVRVGALDGRHPEAGKIALQKIAKVLKEDGEIFIY